MSIPGTRPPSARPKRLRFESLFVAMLISSFGYALILPTLPFLVLRQHAGAEFGGFLVAANALASAIAAPILGWMSDRLGRRTIILVTTLGSAIADAIFAYSNSLEVLLVSRVLAGLMGGNMGVVQAAAADQTHASQRGKAMSLLMVAWALGFVVGPAIGAVLPVTEDRIGFWSGIIAAAASIVSSFAILLLPPKPDGIGGTDDAPHAAARRGGALAWSRCELLALVGVVAVTQTGLVSMTGFWAESTFGWGARQVSLLFFWVSACIVTAQLLLLPGLARRFGEPAAFLVSITALSAACTAIVTNPLSAAFLIMAAPVMFCGITMTQTLCSTFLSQQASSENQGTVMGVANSTASAGRVVGPILCGALFARVHPTAPYWFVSTILTLSLFWFAARRMRTRTAATPRRGEFS